ncbi:HD domain-containing protein [Myxococcota bacterium]
MTRQYSERVGEALKLAADAFSSKIRKGTDAGGQTPIIYLSHLLQVATWVAENRGDEDQIIAAVLHDYLEDIDGATEAQLVGRFGKRVARLVAALSDTTVRPKPPWKARKEAYIDKLRGEPPEVKLISACDKLHNATRILADLREIGAGVWELFSASRDETLWYYGQVTEALAYEWDHPLVEQLRKTVEQVRAEA